MKREMSKKFLIFAVFGLLLTSLVFSGALVVADDVDPANEMQNSQTKGSLADILELNPAGNIAQWLKAWESGKEENVSGVFLKYLFLILIFIFIWSVFAFMNFPSSKIARFIISLIFGILVTMFISPPELFAAMTAYTAAGIGLILVFPVLVLSMFTFAVAVKSHSAGLVVQRVLWTAYSVYLFITSGAGLASHFTKTGKGESLFNSLLGWFTTESLVPRGKTVLFVLFIISIVIFFTAVIGNDYVTHFFAEAQRKGDMHALEDELKRSKAYDKTRAEQTRS